MRLRLTNQLPDLPLKTYELPHIFQPTDESPYGAHRRTALQTAPYRLRLDAFAAVRQCQRTLLPHSGW